MSSPVIAVSAIARRRFCVIVYKGDQEKKAAARPRKTRR